MIISNNLIPVFFSSKIIFPRRHFCQLKTESATIFSCFLNLFVLKIFYIFGLIFPLPEKAVSDSYQNQSIVKILLKGSFSPNLKRKLKLNFLEVWLF